MNLSHGNTLTPAVCHPLWHSVSTRLPHTNTCRSDCCPLSDPRRQRSSPAQPSSHSRGDLRSWRPSLSWRLTHFWHCLDPCGHRTLAVRRSLSDGLTLGAHLTVVAHSATCLFSLSSVPSLALCMFTYIVRNKWNNPPALTGHKLDRFSCSTRYQICTDCSLQRCPSRPSQLV